MALLVSLALMPVLIRVSITLGLVDNPRGNARKLHSTPIPRSGGLGIVLASAMTVLLVLPINDSLSSLFASCLIIIGFGLLDDLVELTPIQKLAGQAIGVTVALLGGMVFSQLPFFPDAPDWLRYAVTFGMTMAVINGVNFSDGMDGLAAGTTLMSLIFILMLALETNNFAAGFIALAISGGLVGFLRFNTHPASLFMGDSGSQFLGLAIMWLAVNVTQASGSQLSCLLPLLILGIPIMDIVQVVPVRIHKKLPLPGPDKEHFHHQFAKLGYSQKGVVGIIYTLQALLLAGAYVLRHSPNGLVAISYALFVLTCLGSLYLAHMTGWRLKSSQQERGAERRSEWLRRFSQTHPYTGKLYGIIISLVLIFCALMSTEIESSMARFAVIVALVFVALKLVTRNRYPVVLGRLVTYFSVPFLMYGLSISVQTPITNTVFNLLIAVFGVFLALSIRTTRNTYFSLTTQDLLVVFFVIILAPELPVDFGGGMAPGEVIFRTALMLYACEYILARGQRARNRLTNAVILILLLNVIHL